MKSLILIPEVKQVRKSEDKFGKGISKLVELIPDIERITTDDVQVIYNPNRKECEYTAFALGDFGRDRGVLPFIKDHAMLSVKKTEDYQKKDIFEIVNEYLEACFEKSTHSIILVSDERFVNNYAPYFWNNVLNYAGKLGPIHEGQAYAFILSGQKYIHRRKRTSLKDYPSCELLPKQGRRAKAFRR